MKNSFISIIVPCYNQAQYLDECLQSVLNQTYQNWECIIVNDGGSDNTEEVAKKWIDKDKRFKYLYKENGGLSSARNAGIKLGKGEYILPLDADDYISTNYIEECLKNFEDPNVRIAFGSAKFFGVKNSNWNLRDIADIKTILFYNNFYSAAIFRKSDWDLVGGYDINMKIAYEDWEFWINILKKGGIAKKNPNAVFYYRIKESSMINDLTPYNASTMRNYIYNKHFDIYYEFIEDPIVLYRKYYEINNYMGHINKNPFRFFIKKIIKRN
jgi:glycosyltransferase involved in cell wall biosynthesis